MDCSVEVCAKVKEREILLKIFFCSKLIGHKEKTVESKHEEATNTVVDVLSNEALFQVPGKFLEILNQSQIGRAT